MNNLTNRGLDNIFSFVSHYIYGTELHTPELIVPASACLVSNSCCTIWTIWTTTNTDNIPNHVSIQHLL